jgi:hypothetical protein
MDQQTITIPVTVDIRIVGFLAHDNILIDRKCSNNRCNIQFSGAVVCPKCGSAPINILTKKGTKMCYSEGTFYPQLGAKTKEEYLNAIKSRKGAAYPTFRFRLVSFADPVGNLMIPAQHPNLRKGSKVEVRIKNHLCLITIFPKSDHTMGAELMFHVFTAYGDSVTVLSGADAIKTGVTTSPVNTNSEIGVSNPTPAPDPVMDNIAQTISQVLNRAKMAPTPDNIALIYSTIMNTNGNACAMNVTTGQAAAKTESEGEIDDTGFYPDGFDGIL